MRMNYMASIQQKLSEAAPCKKERASLSFYS
jgi:hypothetical protein